MSDYGDDDDDFGDIDDEALTQAVTQFELQQSSHAAPSQAPTSSSKGRELNSSATLRSSFPARSAGTNYQQYTLFGEPALLSQSSSQGPNQRATQRLSEEPTHHELDSEATKTWKYPINVEMRDYQFNIVSKALLNNILVALPTGVFHPHATASHR